MTSRRELVPREKSLPTVRNLSVKVYDNQDFQVDKKKLALIPEQLPKPPFRWIITAPTQAGKSNLIKNIICNPDFGYSKFFDEIYIFCGSLDDCVEYQRLTDECGLSDKTNIYSEFKNDEFKSLYASIEEDNLNKPFHTLIIFDDLIDGGISGRNKFTGLDTCFIKGRHANCSVILTSQIYRGINRNMRILNLSHLTVFNGINSTDMNAICQEHQGSLSEDEVKQIIQNNTSKKYSFITLNYKNDMANRFQDSNFNVIQYRIED